MERLQLTFPDETVLTDDEAEEYLAGQLQASFRDFQTTVYQHQESIRAVLTQEPRERNDAIDRLLGLSARRNLLEGISGADLRNQQKAAARSFTEFEQQVLASLAARDRDLAELRNQAEEAGLTRNQLTGRSGSQRAAAIAAALQGFADEASITFKAPTIPADTAALAPFEKSARKALDLLRRQVPELHEQENLLARQQKLLDVRTRLERDKQIWTELSHQVRELDCAHAGREAVAKAIDQIEVALKGEQEALRQTSSRAALVGEAIEYLEATASTDDLCPLCENSAPGLLASLRGLWQAKLQSLAAGLEQKIRKLKDRLKELRAIAARYVQLQQEGDRLAKDQQLHRQQTGMLLGRELTKEDDPLALTFTELDRIARKLRQLAAAIEKRQERLDVIEADLEKVRLIREYLQQEAKKKVLETIQSSAAFRKLEELRDRIAVLIEDAEVIKNAVAQAAREEAEAKLSAAESTIDDFFRRLTNHAAVRGLKLALTTDKRSSRNAYAVTDQDGQDLTPVLSQGDLNALALAIFLGLAVSAKGSASFGFLLLDDPSQSLDTRHKHELARLLDEVAQHKRLIVATMDKEFHNYLVENLTRAKIVYRFGAWTPEHGPAIATDHAGNGSTARLPGPRRRKSTVS